MNMRETTPLQGRKNIEHDSLRDLKHQCSTFCWSKTQT